MDRLIDLCNIQYGYAFDSSNFTVDESYLPLVRIRDVKRGFSETFYSGEYPEEYVIHAGALLIGMDGEFNIARWKSRSALLNQRVCRIIAKENTDEEYLRFALVKALKEVEQKTAFVTVKHLSAKELNKMTLNVAPYEEQKRISEILVRIENLITIYKEELNQFDILIKSRFVEMFGDPVSNSHEWETISCKTAASKIGSGATPKGGKENYGEEGISLIRSMNVYNNRFEYKDLAHITDEQAEKLVNVTIKKNDVLLNITGASVARCCVVPEDVLPARVNQHVSIIRCKNMLLPEFVSYMLTENNYQKILWNIATSNGATREAITKQQIEDLVFILPPLELQNQFATFVHQVDKLKVAVQKSLDETQMLFDSLMQQYFG
ncbi:MAG: restriction endonuclease subunit S [Lachnospiraceae bacterium]|nr:restriction endonuclease subunit S [Lachnospiraceae bacterium]